MDVCDANVPGVHVSLQLGLVKAALALVRRAM